MGTIQLASHQVSWMSHILPVYPIYKHSNAMRLLKSKKFLFILALHILISNWFYCAVFTRFNKYAANWKQRNQFESQDRLKYFHFMNLNARLRGEGMCVILPKLARYRAKFWNENQWINYSYVFQRPMFRNCQQSKLCLNTCFYSETVYWMPKSYRHR